MNQFNFIEYLNYYIDLEFFCIFTASVVIGLCLFSLASLYCRWHCNKLDSALEKDKKGQKMTKTEKWIFQSFENYKKNNNY